MSISRAGTILALILTFAGAAPAFAGPNGWEWMNMMERPRQQRLSMQPAARAQATIPGHSARKPGFLPADQADRPAMTMNFAVADPAERAFP